MAQKLIATIIGNRGTVKVYRDAEYNGYGAKLVDCPDANCFDEDKQSILATAKHMADNAVYAPAITRDMLALYASTWDNTQHPISAKTQAHLAQ